ncbi:MAG: hypothetical protein J6R18_01020, partial [Kiritimatiellae bacterium]|nr:hypothetical protein [Kiritimatiellia bacterium]
MKRNMKRIVVAVLVAFSVCSQLFADENALAAWIRNSMETGVWETGKLQSFEAQFAQRIKDNPNDYDARILRSFVSALAMAENETARDILSKFGYVLDFRNSFAVTGATSPISFWPKSNAVADEALQQCKPVIGRIIEDLSAIPETWTGMILSSDVWPIDENVTLDYADVQYIKSGCMEALGMLYFAGAYDIDADYAKAYDCFNSADPLRGMKPLIPELSAAPSLNSDSGWEKSAVVPVDGNDYIDAFRVAFHGDKMYLRLITKSGAILPQNLGYYFWTSLDVDGMPGEFGMDFEFCDVDSDDWDYDPTDWWLKLPNSDEWITSEFSAHGERRTFVFDLPQELMSHKGKLYMDWMELSIYEIKSYVVEEYWNGEWYEWTDFRWDWLDYVERDDFWPSVWHFYSEQTGLFQKVRNRNHLIYAREYLKLAIGQLKAALAADEKRAGSNLRLIECCALEDYPHIKDRFHKYIDRATESLHSEVTVDVNDFCYFRGTQDIVSLEANRALELIGNGGVFQVSLAPVFNGLSPRDFLPTDVVRNQYFSEFKVALNSVKDPTFAGVFPGADDAVWYRFTGFATDPLVFTGSPRSYVEPVVIPQNLFVPFDLYGANRYALHDGVDGEMSNSMASVYDGYLHKGDSVAGTVQVKVAKPKKGKAKVTVSIQIVGEKKVSVKGEVDINEGMFSATAKDGRSLSLKFGRDGMSGSFGDFSIVGVRSLFSSKESGEKSNADTILAPWLGVLNVSFDRGTLSVSIAKKGKATVKGTVDGEKVSAKGQAIIGDSFICIPVAYSKKSMNIAFTLWLPVNGGEAAVVGLVGASIGRAGTLVPEACFVVSDDIRSLVPSAETRAGGYTLSPEGE